MPDVADVDGLGFFVVGRAVVGFGRRVVGCVVGFLLVGDGLGVGDGDGEVGGCCGASEDGMTSVGEPVLGSPPPKSDLVSAAPPQQSTRRPTTGRSSTMMRRRPSAG